MQLRGATASHVGNVRESNQDRVHFGGYTGVVADGMGGHQGGEMAASIAISEFIDVLDPIAPGGLVELVEEANRAVFEKAADPDLRGMGTTLVALTLRPAEEKVSIVNVGDSRAYFLRGDEFAQVTLDHSLVEDLVRQNRLTPDEALTHPQRNILTRALGIASQVEVDRFLLPAQVGDRFLLCSDGLFNEVVEEDIVGILQECAEPNDAADRLVGAALSAAGRDNITVAVIDVVTDGEGGNLSSEAPETLLVPAVGRSPEPGPSGAAATGTGPAGDGADAASAPVDYGAQTAVGLDVAEPVEELDDYEGEREAEPQLSPDATYDDDDYDDDDYDDATYDDEYDDAAYDDAVITAQVPAHRPQRRRGLGWRPALGLFLLGALAGAAYVGVNWWADSNWYVDVTSENQVAVFRGRPEGFLWTQPSQEFVSDRMLEQLTIESQNDAMAQRGFSSETEARAFIAGLQVETDVTGEVLDDAATEVADDELQGVADELDQGGDEGSESNTTQPANSSGTTPSSDPNGSTGSGGEANQNTGN
ncbi:MAG: protein phosphatase 2C domain-containing protein [Acidimicrobiia bacterium]|nr:protein phosphatase 2C domain-containing protein [Acidimicrobiia bacterium]